MCLIIFNSDITLSMFLTFIHCQLGCHSSIQCKIVLIQMKAPSFFYKWIFYVGYEFRSPMVSSNQPTLITVQAYGRNFLTLFITILVNIAYCRIHCICLLKLTFLLIFRRYDAILLLIVLCNYRIELFRWCWCK